jgi:hypothetical protein
MTEVSQGKLEYGRFYILNWPMLLHALIMMKTLKIMLCGKGAR